MGQSHHSYNIVLFPPKEVEDEAIRLSQLVANNFPAEFVLSGKKLYPHLTLYQLEIPDKNLSTVKKVLLKLFKKAVTAQFQNYFGSENGFISWDCGINENLRYLHKKIIQALNPLRGGLVLPVKKLKYDFLTDNHFRQIREYGSSGLLEYFHPHITITRIKNGKDYQKAMKILPYKRILSVEFKQGVLGKLSTHGTVTKIIEEYNLF